MRGSRRTATLCGCTTTGTRSKTPGFQPVLDCWFGPPSGAFLDEWFRKDAAFDAAIRDRFGTTDERAAIGELDEWCCIVLGALALVIVLDQFPRNLFRDDARAFATDARARMVASDAVARGFDRDLSRVHVYVPTVRAQRRSRRPGTLGRAVRVIEDADVRQGALEYALRHRDIIRRFHRFPRRNRVLGRIATADEIAFLATPVSSF